MKLESSFEDGVPEKFTCDGEDVSPSLKWSDVPEGTKSLALIVYDPDAPSGDFVHWMVYNIPADRDGIEGGEVPGKQVRNDFGKEDYGGPCPPSGKHNYHWVLYALDTEELGKIDDKSEFREKVKANSIGKAELVAGYSRG